MSVTYTATLPVREQTVLQVAALLYAERARRGTRTGTRALSCYWQAVLIIRWLLDGTRVAQLALDNRIGRSTCYEYLHEALGVLAGQAPGLHSALLAAKMAGYDYVTIDGTLVATDRCRTPGAHARGGSVVVGQARAARRKRPGHHRPGRVAAVVLASAAWTRT